MNNNRLNPIIGVSLSLAFAGLAANANAQSTVTEVPKAWKLHCVACHGMDGKVTEAGKMVGARDLSDREYLKTRTDAQLREAILKGAKNEDGIYTMPPYEQILKKREIEPLIRYIRSLPKKENQQ